MSWYVTSYVESFGALHIGWPESKEAMIVFPTSVDSFFKNVPEMGKLCLPWAEIAEPKVSEDRSSNWIASLKLMLSWFWNQHVLQKALGGSPIHLNMTLLSKMSSSLTLSR